MDPQLLVGGILACFALGSAGFLGYYFLAPRRQESFRTLMRSGRSDMGPLGRQGQRQNEAQSDEDLERLKEQARASSKKKKETVSLEDRFFRAGIFTQGERAKFQRFRVVSPVVGAFLGGFGGAFAGVDFLLLGAIFGMLAGFQLPFTMLDRRAKVRSEDILYYLPLVIEQIAIGVSSSLDIGPCIQRVVSMSDERDSHNVVTELLRYAQYHVKSGVSLEDALTEIGVRSGQTELKHAFMSLAQVARHGGEITRQLQELADSVASQRETKIEAKIKKLELQATGPVGLVFLGFLMTLLIGFGLQVKDAFG